MKPRANRKSITRLSLIAFLVVGSLSITTIAFADPSLNFLRSDDQGSILANIGKTLHLPVFLQTFDATITTDKDDYSPGQIVYITGTGFQPGEAVTLQVVHYTATQIAETSLADHAGHDPWTVTADGSGNVSSSWLVEEDSAGQKLLLTADGQTSGLHAQKIFYDAASITLEQCHNFDGAAVDCVKISSNTNYWGSGNAQQGNAKLSEGDNQNFRAIMEDVPPGTYTLVIELDLTKGGKVAYDRYSSPGRIRTATSPNGTVKAGPGVTPESVGVFPCSDSNNNASKWCTPGSGTPYQIPAYSASLIPTAGDPLFAADVLNSQSADVPEYMFLYGAGSGSSLTLSQSGYSFSGTTTGDSSVRFSMSITKTSATATPMVLAWGGHISKTQDYVTSGHTTATTITGSPYHMRLKSFSALQGDPGNQDMQMAASAIVPPTGTLTILKQTIGGVGGPFNFSASPAPSPVPATFSLTTTAQANPASVSWSNVPTGTIRVTETSLPAGWNLTQLACTGDTDNGSVINLPGGYVDIDLDNAEAISCTFTNTAQANLTLVKQVVNDDGGTAVATDWTLSAAGPSNISGAGGTTGSVLPGSYTLSESTGPSGYTASQYSCVKNGAPAVSGNSISLAAGDSATCTITNDDNPPQLKLVKVVQNNDGGTAVANDFTLSANAASPKNGRNFSNAGGSGTFQNVFAGAGYVLSESSVTGYTAGSWSCDGGSLVGSTVTVSLGAQVTCTITNTDDTPKLKLVKVVTNNDGGTSVANDFTLSANAASPNNARNFSNAGGSGTFQNVFANAGYVLSETGPTGYTASSWSCDGGTLVGSTITVPLGAQVTCTITNNDNGPQLKLVKVVQNNDGGTAVANDFTLSATAASPNNARNFSNLGGSGSFQSVFAGAGYVLSETSVTGYTAGSWSCDGGTLVGSTVTLTLGAQVTCTITNTDNTPQLKLVKVVNNDDGGTSGPNDFTLSAAAGSPNNARNFSNAGGSGSFQNVFANAGYVLSETGPTGYTASSWSCDGGTLVGSTITVPLGAQVTCTITNSDNGPKLKLVKVVQNNDGGTAVANDFTLSATAGSPNNGRNFSNAGGSGTFQSVFAGAGYALSESSVAGYTAGSWSCDGGSLVGSTITLSLGAQVTCTITNTDNTPKLKLVKVVQNNDGGTAVANDFTLSAAAASPNDSRNFSNLGGSGSFQNVFAGAGYVLSETSVAGYTGGSWSCDGGTLVGSTVTLGLGAQVICTITNTDDTPKLKLVKVVVNDNGGTAVPNDFTLFASAPSPNNGRNFSNAGGSGSFQSVYGGVAYTLSETGPTGYSASAWSCDGGSLIGSSVTVPLGGQVTCTITNNDIPAQLKVVKILNPSSDPGKFNLQIDGATRATDVGNNGNTGFVLVNAGSHTVGETAGTGTSLSNYASTIGGDCAADGTITLGLGQSGTCTITNNRYPTLNIVKNLRGLPATFGFTVTGPSPETPSLTVTTQDGSAETGVHNILPGAYTAAETTLPAGYTLTDLICTGYTGTGGAGPLDPNGIPTYWGFNANYGDNVVCTFVNSGLTATRTQGFWSTHTALANNVWNGTSNIPGATPLGEDKYLCGVEITAIPQPNANVLMGGFWANIAQKTFGKPSKRNDLDQARMQMLQQYFAAVLNVHAFGTPYPGGLDAARTAYCGTNITAIRTQQGQLASYNTSGDTVAFTPGASATASLSKVQAFISYWDNTTPHWMTVETSTTPPIMLPPTMQTTTEKTLIKGILTPRLVILDTAPTDDDSLVNDDEKSDTKDKKPRRSTKLRPE